jgi:hypothetical protein
MRHANACFWPHRELGAAHTFETVTLNTADLGLRNLGDIKRVATGLTGIRVSIRIARILVNMWFRIRTLGHPQ